MTIENTIIDQMIKAFLVIIPVGGAVRLLVNTFSVMDDPDRAGEIKKRNKNMLGFIALAEGLVGLVGIIYRYYG